MSDSNEKDPRIKPAPAPVSAPVSSESSSSLPKQIQAPKQTETQPASISVYGIGLYILDIHPSPSYDGSPSSSSSSSSSLFYADVAVSIRKFSQSFHSLQEALDKTTTIIPDTQSSTTTTAITTTTTVTTTNSIPFKKEHNSRRICKQNDFQGNHHDNHNHNDNDNDKGGEQNEKVAKWTFLHWKHDEQKLNQMANSPDSIIHGINSQSQSQSQAMNDNYLWMPIATKQQQQQQQQYSSSSQSQSQERPPPFVLDHVRIRSNWSYLTQSSNKHYHYHYPRHQSLWKSISSSSWMFSFSSNSKENHNHGNHNHIPRSIYSFPFLLELGPMIQQLEQKLQQKLQQQQQQQQQQQVQQHIICHMDNLSGMASYLPSLHTLTTAQSTTTIHMNDGHDEHKSSSHIRKDNPKYNKQNQTQSTVSVSNLSKSTTPHVNVNMSLSAHVNITERQHYPLTMDIPHASHSHFNFNFDFDFPTDIQPQPHPDDLHVNNVLIPAFNSHIGFQLSIATTVPIVSTAPSNAALLLLSAHTNTMHEQYGIMIVFGILMSLSSVCIDMSLPIEKYLERFQILAMLLLSATLQQSIVIQNISNTDDVDVTVTDSNDNKDNSFVMTLMLSVYFTIVLSMIRSIFLALVPTTSPQRRKWICALQYYTFHLSLCSFLSLLANLCVLLFWIDDYDNYDDNDDNYDDAESFSTFSLENLFQCFFILVMICFVYQRYQQRKKRKQSNSMEGMEQLYYSSHKNTTTTDTMMITIDEHNWYEWSPEQFMKWISNMEDKSSLSPSQNYNNSMSIGNDISRKLASECLHGACLEHLTLTDLRSFGLSYGDAFWLKEEIRTLIHKYDGGPYRRNQERYRQYQQNDNHLDEINHELNLGQPASRSHMTSSKIDEDIEFNPEIISKAQNIMSERFGLSLPEAKSMANGNENHEGENDDEHQLQHEPKEQQSSHAQSNYPINPSVHSTKGESLIPPDVLNSIPPNIQDIVRRRPDLVRQLMKSNNADFMERKPTAVVEKDTSSDRTIVEVKPTNDAPGGVPSALLSSMPPNIREIAQRRPDLIRQLMASKLDTRNTAQHKDGNTTSFAKSSNAVVRRTNLKSSKLPPVYEDSDSDREDVHLLKKR